MDPIELRIRNEPTEDPEKHVPFSTRARSCPCMRKGAELFGWDKRKPQAGQVRDGELAGRHGHGGRDPRQPAAARQGQRRARTGRRR